MDWGRMQRWMRGGMVDGACPLPRQRRTLRVHRTGELESRESGWVLGRGARWERVVFILFGVSMRWEKAEGRKA